jgi:hypothetical protein
MERMLRNIISSVAIGAFALPVSGCFNNMSGLDGDGTTSSAQSNALLNDSGFANETGPIDTNAVLIGTYNDSGNNGYGILIDLQKSLVATLGQDSVNTILSTIDTNTAMQTREVTIHLPSFAIKATTTLGVIAAGNKGKMRNIMNIRPRLVRIDLTTSALDVPASPSVLQLNNANKTVITYGGMIEGDFVRRMTVLIPFAGVNAGFLPSPAVPAYGDGYPSAAPAEMPGSVKLIPLAGPEGLAIVNHFNSIITSPPYGQSIFNSISSDTIKTISQTYGSLALAVHQSMNSDGSTPICPGTTITVQQQGTTQYSGCNLDGSRKIVAAYLININPANNSGPETFAYCHTGYDGKDQEAAAGVSSSNSPLYQIEFSHPLACNCPLSTGCAATVYDYGKPTTESVEVVSRTEFVDPWPTNQSDQNPGLLAAAISAAARTPAPTGGDLSAGVRPSRVINDFTLSPE